MKKIFLSSFFFISIYAAAQTDTTWIKGGFGGLNINQVAFSHWAAGGENSVSLTALLNLFANYKHNKSSWDNYANFSYGLIRSQYIDKVRKNTDIIDMGSKYGRQAKGKFYYAGLANFKSQFTEGFNYPNDSTVVSNFLAPGYLIASVGMEYKPADFFSLYLSPATGKFTFVHNELIADAGTYGNEAATYDASGNLLTHGEKIRSEFGAYLAARFQKDIMKNVNLATHLNLFDNYTTKVAAKRGNIDVDYGVMVNMKVNKFLGASVYANILYDDDIFIPDLNEDGSPAGTGGPRTQFNEGIGVGFSFKFVGYTTK